MTQILYLIIAAFALHPIHLSKCQMEINDETDKVEITLHVYIDDLQEIIERSDAENLKLGTKKEAENADQLIHQYLSSNLIIKNGDRPIAFNWIGKEQSEDLLAFWCYLETDQIDESNGLTIQYSVLQDLYDDQQNILNIILSNGDEEYFLCRKGDNIAEIK